MPGKLPRQYRGAGASSQRARRRAYDKTRPSASKRLYGRRWRRAAKLYLAENPWCAEHRRRGEWELAVEVDHIERHRGDLGLFWDRDNWQGLCRSCHSAKTLAEMRAGVGGCRD